MRAYPRYPPYIRYLIWKTSIRYDSDYPIFRTLPPSFSPAWKHSSPMNVVVSRKASTTGWNSKPHHESSVRPRWGGGTTLMCHDWNKVVEVKLSSVTNRLQSMVTQIRCMQHNKATQLYWKLTYIPKHQSPLNLSHVERSEKGHTRQAISGIRETS